MTTRGKPKKPKGPAFFAGRVRAALADKSLRNKYAAELKRNTSTARNWTFRRSLRMYSVFFGNALSDFLGKPASIVDIVASLRPKGQTVRVLEDGAGAAVALGQLKKELAGKGVKCEAVALGIHHTNHLFESVKRGHVDKFVVRPGELFVPSKPVDVVLSVFGSIDYSLREFKKDTLLKFAFSLRPNGLLLAGFTSTLFNPRGASEYSGDQLDQQFRQLERAFVKRGFRAKVYPAEPDGSMPDWILVVQRVK